MSAARMRLGEIRSRLAATATTPKYEDRDGLLSTATAWSNLYQHAPSDLRDLEATLRAVKRLARDANGGAVPGREILAVIERGLAR